MAHNKATPVWLVVFPIFKADVYFQTYSFNALSRINEQKRGSNLIRVNVIVYMKQHFTQSEEPIVQINIDKQKNRQGGEFPVVSAAQ